jgi:glucose/arabinose dehydrogenase
LLLLLAALALVGHGLGPAFAAELPPPPQHTFPPVGSPELTVDREFVTGLSFPWDTAFLPDGTMFFTERSGNVKARTTDAAVRTLFSVADSHHLLGLAIDPNYAEPEGTPGRSSIYTCVATTANDVKLVRWVLGADLALVSRTNLLSIEWGGIWSVKEGCRVRFRPGTDELFVTTGDAHLGTNPQNLAVKAGKVLRVTRDGEPYPGNPFGTTIYTYGHRNPQGLAFHPVTNEPYAMDHGPDADDEVDRLVAGGNSGWDPGDPYPPLFGAGVPMTDLTKFPDAMIPAWRSGLPTTAPSGGTFLTGAHWRAWDGALAVANLKGSHLRVMFLGPDGNVTSTTSALAFGVRLRSAVQGPDGSLYVATDVSAPNGAIWKVTPTEAVNDPPVADAGADQTVADQTGFTLSGGGTDPDNEPLTYAWTQVSGPPAVITSPDSAQTTVEGVAGGETGSALVFSLTVTDRSGLSAADEVNVTVSPPDAVNDPPVANAGDDLAVDDQAGFTLSGSGTDPENDPLTYAWTQVSGPPAIITAPAEDQTTVEGVHGGAEGASLVFSLTVTDDGGASSSDEVTVTVGPANRPPVAAAGADQSVAHRAAFTLSGTGTDADGDPLTYTWTQVSGPAAVIREPDEAETLVNGVYGGTTGRTLVFRLTVTDPSGASSSDEVTVSVRRK